MITGRLKVSTDSRKTAQAIAKAVHPDNVGIAGLLVRSRVRPDSVQFYIECDAKIETFISTLDDLIASIQAARETLKGVRSREEG